MMPTATGGRHTLCLDHQERTEYTFLSFDGATVFVFEANSFFPPSIKSFWNSKVGNTMRKPAAELLLRLKRVSKINAAFDTIACLARNPSMIASKESVIVSGGIGIR